MGTYCLSMHFKASDGAEVHRAAASVAAGAGCKMLVAPAAGGWVHVYPRFQEWTPGLTASIAAKARVKQAIAFLLQDSDVLSYWYFDSGELADRYNSCPDYFGEATSEDMAAVGNPEALASLLPDPARRSQFAEAIAGRMINGEWTAPGPDFEDERLEHLAGLLGIKGAAGFYDSLEAGEEVDGVGSAAVMHEVG